MYMQLVRAGFTDTSTEGSLYVNGTFECFTLEDTDRFLEDGGTKVYGKTAIPKGTYEVKLTYSNRFKRVIPEILGIPNYTGVRIHSGNTSKDTDGCILVGSTNVSNQDDFIGNSKIALERLIEKMKTEDIITIEIV